MNKRKIAVLTPAEKVVDYVINEGVVQAWTENKKTDICPISGQLKNPAHYINKLEFEQLEAMQKGLGTEATFAVRSLFYKLSAAKKQVGTEPLPDIMAIKTDAEKYLALYPEASRAELEKVLTDTFGIKCGAKAIAGSVYRIHHLRLVGEGFENWLMANPQAIILPKDKIAEEFSSKNQLRENDFTLEGILIRLERIQASKEYKQLVRAAYDKIVSNWITANGFDSYTPRAIKRIMADPEYKNLDVVELEFIYSRHKKLIKGVAKAAASATLVKSKMSDRERFYQLHLAAAKKHDDGLLNSHELAKKIMLVEKDAKSFKTLVKAIIETRSIEPKNKARQKPLPNRMRIQGQPAQPQR